MKEIGEYKPRITLKILIVLFLIHPIWIHSQEILNTDSTYVTYNKLNEFAKFVVFRDSAQNIFDSYRTELRLKDSIIFTKELRLNYKDSTINSLSKINVKSDLQIVRKDGLLEISDLKFKEQRRKKWTYGITGTALGIIFGFLLSI